MKPRFLFLFIILIQVVCCSDNSTEPKLKMSEDEKVAVTRAHETITNEGILAIFINELTEENYRKAIELLHPKLKNAWRIEKFEKDLKAVREQLSGE